jgi:hypothetical protein
MSYLINKSMSIAGRSSDLGIIRFFRLPTNKCVFDKFFYYVLPAYVRNLMVYTERFLNSAGAPSGMTEVEASLSQE